jgi:hypothetical protein
MPWVPAQGRDKTPRNHNGRGTTTVFCRACPGIQRPWLHPSYRDRPVKPSDDGCVCALSPSTVMAGLVPAIPIGRAPSQISGTQFARAGL